MAQEAFRVTVNPKVKIILQAVTDVKPAYEVYGKTKCLSCDRWCWLDEDTFPAVMKGAASPVCIECAKTQITEWTPIGNAKDL